jgi:hypothetical protein
MKARLIILPPPRPDLTVEPILSAKDVSASIRRRRFLEPGRFMHHARLSRGRRNAFAGDPRIARQTDAYRL